MKSSQHGPIYSKQTISASSGETSSCHVAVDGFIVLKAATLSDGLKALFASFFIFNIRYTKGIGNTLEFIQRLIFRLETKDKRKTERSKPMKLAMSLI